MTIKIVGLECKKSRSLCLDDTRLCAVFFYYFVIADVEVMDPTAWRSGTCEELDTLLINYVAPYKSQPNHNRYYFFVVGTRDKSGMGTSRAISNQY